MRQDKHGLAVNISLCLVSAVLALSAGELTLRANEILKDIKKGGKLRLSENKVIGYEFKPNYRSQGFITNSFGFRGPEIEKEKKEGVFRVVVMGDSIAAAPNIKEAETYASVIRTSLNRPDDHHHRYEVINTGVMSYSVWQYLEVYKVKVRPLKPDLVILGICQNDFVRHLNFYTDMFGVVRSDMEVKPHEMDLQGEGFVNSLLLVQKLRAAARITRTSHAEERAPAQLAKSIPTLHGRWDEGGGATLTRLARELKRDGVRFIFVIFPYRFQLLDTNAIATDERFSRFCADENVECLDLMEPYRKAGPGLYPVNDPLHPDAEGHAIAAHEIVALIAGKDMSQ
ncbi:MAG: SGNH/GDSL hydrolase family protein [Nitrospinae bacterium]|nr:SGNH/GDSL hydrolase family protein [Nitrospinota bacterium]